jgi:hypothetical protein
MPFEAACNVAHYPVMKNVQADTVMREDIADSEPEAPTSPKPERRQ